MDYRNDDEPFEGNVYCIVHKKPRETSRPIQDEPAQNSLGRLSLRRVSAEQLELEKMIRQYLNE